MFKEIQRAPAFVSGCRNFDFFQKRPNGISRFRQELRALLPQTAEGVRQADNKALSRAFSIAKLRRGTGGKLMLLR